MIQLEIVTPDRLFLSEEVEMVIVRGVEGDIAIMENTSPITTPIKIGKLRVFKDGKERKASITEGYISSSHNVVTIVADAAEWPDEIDFNRAEEARLRAEKRLKEKQDFDLRRAEAALKRALNRLDLKED